MLHLRATGEEAAALEKRNNKPLKTENMIETKIKEVNASDIFPALYSSENRETIILVKKRTGDKTLEGVVVYPKSAFGEYSMSWSEAKYKRMGRGSELTIKFLQE